MANNLPEKKHFIPFQVKVTVAGPLIIQYSQNLASMKLSVVSNSILGYQCQKNVLQLRACKTEYDRKMAI